MQTQKSDVPFPEVRSTSFLLVPDWQAFGEPWRERLIAFYQAFSSSDDVSLVLPFDPERDDLGAIETALAQVAEAAGLTLEQIADTVLHPTPREPRLWRSLAARATAVLASPARPDDWLVDLATPILLGPTRETLRAFRQSLERGAPVVERPVHDLEAEQRRLLDAFLTLVAVGQKEDEIR